MTFCFTIAQHSWAVGIQVARGIKQKMAKIPVKTRISHKSMQEILVRVVEGRGDVAAAVWLLTQDSKRNSVNDILFTIPQHSWAVRIQFVCKIGNER